MQILNENELSILLLLEHYFFYYSTTDCISIFCLVLLFPRTHVRDSCFSFNKFTFYFFKNAN